MPKVGYHSITISDEIYAIAEDDAKTEHRSVQNYIKHLILQEQHFKQKYHELRERKKNGTQ